MGLEGALKAEGFHAQLLQHGITASLPSSQTKGLTTSQA